MNPLLLIGAMTTSVIAGVLDHKSGRIPNTLTAVSFFLAAVAHMALGGARGFWVVLFGATLTGLVPLLFFLVSRGAALGGGDVKVLLVLGAWLGPALGVEVELWSFVLLLAVTMARQLRDGNLGAFMQRSFSIRALRGVPTLDAESASFQGSPSSIQVRFGPYLAVVTCLSCLGIWFVRLLPGWAGELFY